MNEIEIYRIVELTIDKGTYNILYPSCLRCFKKFPLREEQWKLIAKKTKPFVIVIYPDGSDISKKLTKKLDKELDFNENNIDCWIGNITINSDKIIYRKTCLKKIGNCRILYNYRKEDGQDVDIYKGHLKLP